MKLDRWLFASSLLPAALICSACANSSVAEGPAGDNGDSGSDVTLQVALGVTDPGVRGGAAAAGGIISGATSAEQSLFTQATATFQEVEQLADGLGPTFNLNSCSGCHGFPAVGGSAPATNPQVALATANGAKNTIPSFITSNGPIREVRFKSDSGVHSLFTVDGINDGTGNASSCALTQPDFTTAQQQNNLSFRIPTPTFGSGLIENIAGGDLVTNLAANASQKSALGISGVLNRSGNDGTVTKFGWKAQNKSLLIFAGEAYNVEMGITNELFTDERAESNTSGCIFDAAPNDITHPDNSGDQPFPVLNDIDQFAFFMRFLAPPTPSTTTPGGAASIGRGSVVFSAIGCALCHTPSLTTHTTQSAALNNVTVNLFSDLALHHMGPGLADGVTQGAAAGDMFRTAPLWGLGQRIFFLHDGRTSNLISAISAHASVASGGTVASEANTVIVNFNFLNGIEQQDLLNFLRSL